MKNHNNKETFWTQHWQISHFHLKIPLHEFWQLTPKEFYALLHYQLQTQNKIAPVTKTDISNLLNQINNKQSPDRKN